MTFSDRKRAEDGRGWDATPCPVCEAAVVDGDLCPTHRAMVDRDVPAVLEKLTPPKDSGHVAPDWLYTVALILFILVLLRFLGAI